MASTRVLGTVGLQAGRQAGTEKACMRMSTYGEDGLAIPHHMQVSTWVEESVIRLGVGEEPWLPSAYRRARQ